MSKLKDQQQGCPEKEGPNLLLKQQILINKNQIVDHREDKLRNKIPLKNKPLNRLKELVEVINNLQLQEIRRAKIHTHEPHQNLSNVQSIQDAQTCLNTLRKEMAKRAASCQTATTLVMATLNPVLTATIPTEDGLIIVTSSL